MYRQKEASDAPLSDSGWGSGEVESRGEMARQGERAQGGEAGVAQRRVGGTRRARVGSHERNRRGSREKKQVNPRSRAARGEVDAGGQQRHKGATRLAQRKAMPMTRIEPYRPPRPSIRELMEGRLARADDGGLPPKGYLARPPRSAYRTEDRAEAERRVRSREIRLWRGEEPRRAHGAGQQQ